MSANVRVAKELVKLARTLIADNRTKDLLEHPRIKQQAMAKWIADHSHGRMTRSEMAEEARDKYGLDLDESWEIADMASELIE